MAGKKIIYDDLLHLTIDIKCDTIDTGRIDFCHLEKTVNEARFTACDLVDDRCEVSVGKAALSNLIRFYLALLRQDREHTRLEYLRGSFPQG